MSIYVVGYSNSGAQDWMSVSAKSAHGAAGIAEQEGAELVLWVEGPFKSYADADQFARDNA